MTKLLLRRLRSVSVVPNFSHFVDQTGLFVKVEGVDVVTEPCKDSVEDCGTALMIHSTDLDIIRRVLSKLMNDTYHCRHTKSISQFSIIDRSDERFQANEFTYSSQRILSRSSRPRAEVQGDCP